MPPLDDCDRKRLLQISAALCATSLLLVPLAGRSAFEVQAERQTFDRRFAGTDAPVKLKEPALAVSRDPFEAGDGGARRPVLESGAAVTSGIVGMHVVRGESTGIALPPSEGIVVRAIVSGAAPRALVESGGATRIVAPGDALAGSTVLSIGRAGIRLKSGVTLSIAEQP